MFVVAMSFLIGITLSATPLKSVSVSEWKKMPMWMQRIDWQGSMGQGIYLETQ